MLLGSTAIKQYFLSGTRLGTKFQRDGSQFDRLFKDGDTYKIGTLNAKTIHTPGHTPACMVHVIEDSAFVGDTLFAGSVGRTDLPNTGGDFEVLSNSIKTKLWPLDPDTIVHPGHGPLTSIGIEKQTNPYVGQSGQNTGGFIGKYM